MDFFGFNIFIMTKNQRKNGFLYDKHYLRIKTKFWNALKEIGYYNCM